MEDGCPNPNDLPRSSPFRNTQPVALPSNFLQAPEIISTISEILNAGFTTFAIL